MEGFTYLLRKPATGDIAVFKLQGIQEIHSSQRDAIFVKRIVGRPGDQIRIAAGKLLVNGQ